MRIRDFQFASDYDDVLVLWNNAGHGIQLSPSDSPEEIQKKLLRDPDLFLVAELEGEIIGAVLGGFDGRRGMVYHLAVRQDQQGKGYGRQLMQAIEERLRSKGCLKYYLLVTKTNEEAISFYESLGSEVMALLVMGKVIE